MRRLEGRRIAILVTDYGVEEAELDTPRRAVVDAGGTAVIVGTTGTEVQTLVGDKDRGSVFPVDAAVDEAHPEDYDALILPGGTINADTLRTVGAAVDLVGAFAAAGKPVAAICHGPWALVEADIVRGKTLTSYPSLRTDIRNAGGTWVDETVRVCRAEGWTLITSRTPGDLPAFADALVAEVAAS